MKRKEVKVSYTCNCGEEIELSVNHYIVKFECKCGEKKVVEVLIREY